MEKVECDHPAVRLVVHKHLWTTNELSARDEEESYINIIHNASVFSSCLHYETSRDVQVPVTGGAQVPDNTGRHIVAVQRELRHPHERPRPRATLPRQGTIHI